MNSDWRGNSTPAEWAYAIAWTVALLLIVGVVGWAGAL